MRISRTYKTIHFGMNYQHNTLVTSGLFLFNLLPPRRGKEKEHLTFHTIPYPEAIFLNIYFEVLEVLLIYFFNRTSTQNNV